MGVAALILAAGVGRRFGGPKYAAQLGGRTFLERVADTARAAGLSPVLAVVPPNASVPAGVTAVANPEPWRGISRSLQIGILRVPEDADAVLVLLVDQPTMPVAHLAAVLAARGPRPLVAAEANGRLGPPVLVERGQLSLVNELSGDTGLRAVLARHPELVQRVRVPAHPPDVDRPEDLVALEPG